MKFSYFVVICAVLASARGQASSSDPMANIVSMVSHLTAAISNNNDFAEVGPQLLNDMRGVFTSSVQQMVSTNQGAPVPPPSPEAALGNTIDSVITRIFVPLTQIAQTATTAAMQAANADPANPDGDDDDERRRRKK